MFFFSHNENFPIFTKKKDMHSKKFLNLFLVVFALFLFSCASETIAPEPPAPPAPPPSPTDNKISFAGEIQPIFNAKCAVCHGVGQNPPVLSQGKSYQSLMSIPGMIDTIVPANSDLYKSMITGGSMAAYSSKANADSVFKWIYQGAKNN